MPPKGHASLAGVAVFFLWSGVQKRRRVRLAASYSCATGMLAVSPAPREESSSSSAFPGRDLNMSPQTSSGPPPGPLDISEESRSRFRVAPAATGPASFSEWPPPHRGPARYPDCASGGGASSIPFSRLTGVLHSPICPTLGGTVSLLLTYFRRCSVRIGGIESPRVAGGIPPHPGGEIGGSAARLARLASSIKSG